MKKNFILVIYDRQKDEKKILYFDSFEKADEEMVKECEEKGIFHFNEGKACYIPNVGCCGYALNYCVAIYDTAGFTHVIENIEGKKILLLKNIKEND